MLSNRNPMHILLVDDDVLMRQVLGRWLIGAGIRTISEADDGEMALAVLEHIRPDLILTDYQMPRLDGIGLLRGLQARGRTIPVIMLSAQTDQSIIVAALKAGAHSYFPKPVQPVLLLERIWQILGPSHLAASA